MHIENASQFPRIFYARHMQPGTVGYEEETILVDTDGMKNLLKNNAVGKPVYVHHQAVELDRLQETAHGYITKSFYNDLDGWGWFEVLAIDDQMHNAIKKGWSVSNAYKPTQWAEGGTKNNCKYDREVLNGEITHLAIVPNPRYENATIMTADDFKAYQEKLRKNTPFHNSKTPPEKGLKTMFKMFKTEKKEVTSIDADTSIELANGKTVTVAEMIAAVEAADAAKAAKELENSTQEIEINGKKVAMKDLVAKFNEIENAKAKGGKKNANEDKGDDEDDSDEDDSDDADKDKKNKAGKAKKNAAKGKAKKNADDDDDMENSDDDADAGGAPAKESLAHYQELCNANVRKQNTQESPIITAQTKLDRGANRYGSVKK